MPRARRDDFRRIPGDGKSGARTDLSGQAPSSTVQQLSADGWQHPSTQAGEMAGLACLDGRWMGAQQDTLDLYFLFTSRSSRGTGIGGELFEKVAAEATARGAQKLYITAANSKATVDFYRRHGARVARAEELSEEMLADEAEAFDPTLREALGADIHLVRLLQ